MGEVAREGEPQGVVTYCTNLRAANLAQRAEAEYGFTRLRFAAHATLLWLGAIFLLILVTTPRHLPRATLALTGATVLLFALADPDRRIAQHNLQRYERTGKLDHPYLKRLSADAGLSCPRPDGLSGYNLARARARKAC